MEMQILLIYYILLNLIRDVLQFVGSQEQSERSDQSPAIPLTEIKHSLPPPSPPPPTLPLPPKSMKASQVYFAYCLVVH
eukprot:m.123475 g.123475  ORF g.123475 m.123475 type:complete len:79 (+) comp37822_c2_seq34:1675-1911(+)